MKLRKIRKEVFKGISDFGKFNMFTCMLLFLFFLIWYRQALPCLILSIFMYIFLKVSHFLFDIIQRISSEVSNGNI